MGNYLPNGGQKVDYTADVYAQAFLEERRVVKRRRVLGRLVYGREVIDFVGSPGVDDLPDLGECVYPRRAELRAVSAAQAFTPDASNRHALCGEPIEQDPSVLSLASDNQRPSHSSRRHHLDIRQRENHPPPTLEE